MQSEQNNAACGAGEGQLPGACAAMVFPYVPMQANASRTYAQGEGLCAGTLFPGLHLPFQKEMKSKMGGQSTPLIELMALDFAIAELGLYLDTHKDDKEAYALYDHYVRLYQEGRKKYEEQYGPLQQTDTTQFGQYRWLENPWPWDGERGSR